MPVAKRLPIVGLLFLFYVVILCIMSAIVLLLENRMKNLRERLREIEAEKKEEKQELKLKKKLTEKKLSKEEKNGKSESNRE